MGRLFTLVVLGLVAAGAVASLADIKRYMKIRAM